MGQLLINSTHDPLFCQRIDSDETTRMNDLILIQHDTYMMYSPGIIDEKRQVTGQFLIE
jgi:hypothetical protein